MSTTKTAISIDEVVFKKAEKLSAKLHMSRSKLYTQALEYMIERSESLEIIKRMNEVYSEKIEGNDLVPKTYKARMRRMLDKW